MPQGKYFTKRRRRLMEKDPHCYWCRKPLKLYAHFRGGRLPDDYPTIDHLKSKFFGQRPDVFMKEYTLVIACSTCNNARSKKELKENRWRQCWKSASFPKWLWIVGWILRLIRRIKRA